MCKARRIFPCPVERSRDRVVTNLASSLVSVFRRQQRLRREKVSGIRAYIQIEQGGK